MSVKPPGVYGEPTGALLRGLVSTSLEQTWGPTGGEDRHNQSSEHGAVCDGTVCGARVWRGSSVPGPSRRLGYEVQPVRKQRQGASRGGLTSSGARGGEVDVPVERRPGYSERCGDLGLGSAAGETSCRGRELVAASSVCKTTRVVGMELASARALTCCAPRMVPPAGQQHPGDFVVTNLAIGKEGPYTTV